MRGARPSGCRAMRSAFGRSRRLGATPSMSTAAPALADTICHDLSTTMHGDGLYAPRTRSTPSRTAAISGSSRDRSPYTGASPAASSNWFCSRSGTSSTVASRSTIARLGVDRPVSMKLTWRAETSASIARSNWLSRRRCRHSRISEPKAGVCTSTVVTRPVLPSLAVRTITSGVIAPITCAGHRSR